MKAFVQHYESDSDKMVLQSLVPFTELNAKALFTQKALSNEIETDANLMGVDANAEYYQRRLDPRRLREIKKYIYNAILDERDKVAVSALFPTSMILAIELDTLPEVENNQVVIERVVGDRIYIVDGQHRLMAMRQLYEELYGTLILGDEEKYILEYLKKYKFSCTILVNFDLWEQGQVFVNVNFRQKPVNRSLYYDVFGAEYIDSDNPKHLERNKIYLAHEITRFMNETQDSPFYKKIKMLGTGKGYISQSFFVEALLPLFKTSGVWFYDTTSQSKSERFLDSYKSELYNFFIVVARTFEKYWGENEDGKVHFICKTTGVGAFTRLMAIIHRQASDHIIYELGFTSPGEENPQYVYFLKNYLFPIKDHEERLFGNDSKFSGTGGRGLEMALFREMRDILTLKGLLPVSQSNMPLNNGIIQVKKNISDRQLSELKKIGLDNMNEILLNYMNNGLPSEVDALGTHCRIDNVFDVRITSFLTTYENEVIIKGRFVCKVAVAFDSDRDNIDCFYEFPAFFTTHMQRIDGEWRIVDEGTKLYVNTDKYYM